MSPSDRKNFGPAPFQTDGSHLFGNSGSEVPPEHNWRECFPEIIGRSAEMQSVLQLVAKVARSDIAVLIHGESGTGKELIAAALHRLSSRASRRYVAINCGAIPESLLESELFGHEKGAFTGAHQRQAGRFEQAAGGTLFLDEIGDMPQHLQVKLLRVLQEKQFTRLGGSETLVADVRIIAATNVDLAAAVQEGRFRNDLYYRLNVLPIELAPLRARRQDISDLLHHFLAQANQVHGLHNDCYFSQPVLDFLMNYDWPGNVRELQNLIERLVVTVHGGEIGLHHLPNEYRNWRPGWVTEPTSYHHDHRSAEYRSVIIPARSDDRTPVMYPDSYGSLPEGGLNLSEFIESLENSLIVQALERTKNNKQQAAKLLGLNRTTLVERIKKRKICQLGSRDKEGVEM